MSINGMDARLKGLRSSPTTSAELPEAVSRRIEETLYGLPPQPDRARRARKRRTLAIAAVSVALLGYVARTPNSDRVSGSGTILPSAANAPTDEKRNADKPLSIFEKAESEKKGLARQLENTRAMQIEDSDVSGTGVTDQGITVRYGKIV